MEAGGSKCHNSQNDILNMKISEFTCVFTILVLPEEIFFGVITGNLLHL